jgi:hypothetical protein
MTILSLCSYTLDTFSLSDSNIFLSIMLSNTLTIHDIKWRVILMQCIREEGLFRHIHITMSGE